MEKFEKKQKHFIQILFGIMYKLYNSYFVFLGNFVNFGILGFLDFYIFIYHTCRSLTRVGLLHRVGPDRRCEDFKTTSNATKTYIIGGRRCVRR